MISGVRYTERIFKVFVRQNPRDQTLSLLYREVRYIRGSLYPDSTVFLLAPVYLLFIFPFDCEKAQFERNKLV